MNRQQQAVWNRVHRLEQALSDTLDSLRGMSTLNVEIRVGRSARVDTFEEQLLAMRDISREVKRTLEWSKE